MNRLTWLWIALLTSLGVCESGLAVDPIANTGQRVEAAGHAVIDPHPGRMILARDAYTLSYDMRCRIPAWTAYEATPEVLLPLDQPDSPGRFLDDPQIAAAARSAEYDGAIERGLRMMRLVPSAFAGGDRESQLPALTAPSQADLMTNVVPMYDPGFGADGGLWARLHQWIRDDLVARNQLELSIISGVVFGHAPVERIGPNDDICVPPMFFVVISKKAEEGDEFKALAFLFPHQRSSSGDLADFLVTVDTIESLTNLDLFAELDDEAEQRLEQSPPASSWDGPMLYSMGAVRLERIEMPQMLEVEPEPAVESAPPPMPFGPEAMPDEAVPLTDSPDMVGGVDAEAAPADGEGEVDDTQKEKDRLVTVFYGTDRNRTGSLDPNDIYGSVANESNELRLGVCQVSIPPVHEQGAGRVERPFLELLPENPERHVVLFNVNELPKDVFIKSVVAKLDEADGRQAFVFIHGYNNSFADAARRTAQMWFDLDLDIAPIFYSWPSKDRLWSYYYDGDELENTVPKIRQFLKLVLDECKPDKLHIICHSMGSELFSEVLADVADDNSGRIDQIILAAPDIDADSFTKEIVPHFEGVGTRLTIYVSERDRALLASRYVNRFPGGSISERLGARIREELYGLPRIDQVNASDVDTSVTGHLYYGDKSEILGDIRGALMGIPAEKRELIRVKKHYAFPTPGKIDPVWDLRYGWEWQNFQYGWEVMFDRKVVAILAICLLLLAFMWLRIRLLKRRLRRAVSS